jgi:subtilisin family serine protease
LSYLSEVSGLLTRRRGLTGAALLTALFLALPAISMRAPAVSQQDALRKISPHLSKSAEGDTVEFLVVLGQQADLSAAYSLTDRLERGYFTRNSLYYLAESSQAPLESWLSEHQVEHRSFYIVNAIWVRASMEVARSIAFRPEVSRIEANPVINNFTHPELMKVLDTTSPNAEVTNSVSAVPEQGVTYIRAPEVWASGFTGQGIVIGGADTGIKWDHPALKAHYRGWNGTIASHDFNWHDSVHIGGGACGANTTAPCDDNGHGTHTVGTAIGDDGAGNQIGVAPGAKFVGCRNMDQGNGTPARYLECMEFMLAPYPVNGTPAQGDPSKRPHITINSWTCPSLEGCSPSTLLAAVEAQRAAGIMMVVAAGNEGALGCSTIGRDIGFAGPPSHYDAAYTVGAVSFTGLVASFSSRGPITVDGSNRVKPDITAPGVGIRSAYQGNSYVFLDGTSMATPHVAGAIALLWSAEPALQRQIATTETLLNSSAVKVETTECSSTGIPNNVYGYGRLDIKAAVDAARPSVSPLTYNVGAGVSNLFTNVTALSGVAWAATSNVTWIVMTGATNGTGSGVVNFQVLANSGGGMRNGTLTVAGKTVTVTQEGALQYIASGKVYKYDGTPFQNVTVNFSRMSGNGNIPNGVLTNSEGEWFQSGFDVGTTYRVIVNHTRQVFSPRAREFSAPSSSLNFQVTTRPVTIGGPIILPVIPAATSRARGRSQ